MAVLVCANLLGACAEGSELPGAAGDVDPGTSGAGGDGAGGAGVETVSAQSGTGAGGDSTCSADGETQSCYGGEQALAGVGACVLGTRTCEASGEFALWGECLGWVEPSDETCDGLDNDCNGTADEGCCVPQPEVCDGLDNDCNGTADEGCCVPQPEVCDGLDNDCNGFVDEIGCGPGSCGGGPAPCVELAAPGAPVALASGCTQQFPPPQSLPCPIANPGTQYYVSSASGSDGNDGLTPATAWKTLCHAASSAPDGSTVQVAEGTYLSAHVYLGKELTLKGGYDATFTSWDPDAHPSMFHGQLTLDHNAAVFGGFRMIANPLHADSWSYGQHFVGAGTLLRNYVEIVAVDGIDPNVLNLYGIVASACSGGISVLRCNDIYVRSAAAQAFVVSAVEYGNKASHDGHGVLDSNRICQDGGGPATGAVGGHGSCSAQPVSLLLKNNVIEKAGFGGGAAMEFYGCGGADMTFVLTNNTFLSSGDGIVGYEGPPSQLSYQLTNNIVYGTGSGSSAVDVGTGAVEIASSEANLTFGFSSNGIFPAPVFSAGDDTSGAASAASVFTNASGGDLTLQPAGQGAGTGINVHADPVYGTVITDVLQAPRPAAGAWDRGAYGL
jgi:hypothetical protein